MKLNLETRITNLEQATSGKGEFEDLLLAYRDGRPLPEPTPRVRRVLELIHAQAKRQALTQQLGEVKTLQNE